MVLFSPIAGFLIPGDGLLAQSGNTDTASNCPSAHLSHTAEVPSCYVNRRKALGAKKFQVSAEWAEEARSGMAGREDGFSVFFTVVLSKRGKESPQQGLPCGSQQKQPRAASPENPQCLRSASHHSLAPPAHGWDLFTIALAF